uniref:KIAA0825 n=1 Tax=Astatotilapia calliptera TaxID=8154 RepID=A0AAX7VDN2_ASTCA
MREQLTSYCIQACYTCILQDAESHHWADPKPFYEGERCSFSVQMWFYFLCGLRSDLWAVLPAELARDVLGQVLTDTLQLLVRRYARARASYKRHLQIRDGLMGQASLACQLRLLTSDPGCNPKLLLQMLLYRDCHLPRILLENSYFCQENSSEMSTESCKAGDDFMMSLFNLFSCLNNVPKALTQALQPYLERAHIWEHLYTLADTTRTVPIVVSCVRDIVTKSTNSLLQHLVSMVLGWQATEEPGAALFKRTVPENVLAKIPKDWNYTPLDVKGKDTVAKTIISLAIQALSFIFTNLPMAVASLPLPIRFLFQVAEKHLSQHARQLRLVGLLIWALLGCLIQGLEDPDTLEQISGLALDRSAKDRLSLLAECVQAAIGIQQKGVPKPSVHKVIQALEEKRPKWTQLQLQKARKLCSDSVFEQGSERGVAAAELTEQKIGLMLLEVCHKAGGSSYLRQIYHIIQGNEELLMSKLSGSSDLPNDPPLFVKFDLGPESHVGGARFNPLHQFDHIGKKKLDQSAVVDWAWDWARLLPAYQGMSRVTFRALLANRWEMQEGAQLEDGEKAMVEELEKAFLGCCCTPGPQNPPEADETPGKQAQGKTQPSASDEGSTP